MMKLNIHGTTCQYLLVLSFVCLMGFALGGTFSSLEVTPSVRKNSMKAARTFCRPTEACLYGFPRNEPTFQYRIVPTWCRCRPEESCDFSNNDPLIRADVYRCYKV